MKKKQEGGIRLFGTRKDPLNSTKGNSLDRSMTYISSSIGSIIPRNKETNTASASGAEEAGKAMIKDQVQNKSNAAYSDSTNATTLVATLAAANQQSTCNTTYESIKKQLEDKNIKSISKKATKRLITLGTASFDNIASTVEKSEAFIKMVKNISFAMETIKSTLPPGTTAIIGIAESLGVAASKYAKHFELVYLSAQCLIYVSNISHDLAEIHSFYNNKHVKDKNITIDQSLYETLVKSIFTFTYFLIDNIDFESKISGIDQFKFWYSFLSRIDFSQTPETKKGCIYKYSCKECIPQELREKLQYISIYDKNYDKIIKLDDVFDTSKPDTKKKSRLYSIYKSTSSSASAVSSAASSVASSVASSAASMAARGKGLTKSEQEKPNRPTERKGLFGFCSDEIVEQCKNYNDIIMRLIEFNIYKLFRNTYINQNNLPIDFASKGAGITSEMFYDYIFKDKYIDAIKDNTEYNAYADDNNSRSNLSDDKLHDDKLQTLLRNRLMTVEYSTEEVLEERICLEFLFELKRIIVDLVASTMLDNYKKKFIIEPGYKERGLVSRHGKFLVEKGKFLVSLSSAYFGDVRVKYNIFLREYVIMTGNFATILSRYSLDYNKLTQKDKEIIRGEVNEDIKSIEDKLKLIENKIQQAASGGIENAQAAEKAREAEEAAEKAREAEEAAVMEEEDIEGSGQVNRQGGGKITHNRVKKHSKKYKIYKKYKHSKKIKNKRKQKQY